MKKRYLRTALGILGIVGIIAFLLFPDKKKYDCLEKKMDFYQYGNSESYVDSIELEPFGFKCILLNESGYCGIGFSFLQEQKKIKNWNLMDSLIIELKTAYDGELVVQILTFDQEHTDLEKRSTMKPIIKELKLTREKKHYSIYMEHFYTPDYWFEQQKAKDNIKLKRFSAITGLEIFSGWTNQVGYPLELKIESICAQGHSNVPFVVLVCYIGILIAIAISVRVRV